MASLELKPREGFKWSCVTWGVGDAVRTDKCSYCGEPFPDDDGFVPLILAGGHGRVAEFCDPCQEKWFGILTFRDPPPEDEPA